MADENPWKPGDVVQVKSGGPAMTVAGEDTLGKVIFGTNPQRGTFYPAVLKKHEPSSSTVRIGRA